MTDEDPSTEEGTLAALTALNVQFAKTEAEALLVSDARMAKHAAEQLAAFQERRAVFELAAEQKFPGIVARARQAAVSDEPAGPPQRPRLTVIPGGRDPDGAA